MAYNPNPKPQTGVLSPFGAVPGPLGLPDPSGDLSRVYPNLGGTNKGISDAIMAQLSGNLSPGTLKAMQDYEAQFATRSGMPGTNAIPGTLGYNRGVRDIGLTAEQQVQQGLRNYGSLIPTISSTQTVSPALQSEIAATNAVNASAPNPAMAQTYAQNLLNWYMQQMRSPAGGTGRYAPAVPRYNTGANLGGYNPWQSMADFDRQVQESNRQFMQPLPTRGGVGTVPPPVAPGEGYGELSANGFAYNPDLGVYYGDSGQMYSPDEVLSGDFGPTMGGAPDWLLAGPEATNPDMFGDPFSNLGF